MTDDVDPLTLAYMVATLRAQGDGEAADDLIAKYGEGADEPDEPVAKAMSACDSATGGVLVPPAAPKKPKKKKNKRALIDKVLKSLEGDRA
jgi:hypothetical protein